MNHSVKPLLIAVLAFLIAGSACAQQSSSPAQDDIDEVKAAFGTLIEYQKTDDIRSLDLFSTNCPVTLTVIDGSKTSTVTLPPEAFRKLLRQQIALKLGNHDTYEDVKYSEVRGTNVLVTAMVRYADSGKRGPFFALYGRDTYGFYKIQHLKVTMFASGNTK